MTNTQQDTLQDRAKAFHALHHGSVLTLPNAWDVASARIVEEAGAAAVATTSAGVAWSLGAPDGNKLSREHAVELIRRITAAVAVPVTADIESGFADDAAGVAETIRMVIDAGAVGVNIEDGAGPGLLAIEEYAQRVAAAREAADAAGVSLFINARTDVYLRGIGDPEDRLEHTVERAGAYVAAGADGIFVPGVVDIETLKALVAEIDAPLNVMAGEGAPPVPELAALGVARVSVGPSLAEAAYAVTRRSAVELLTTGTYDALAGALTFGELNALLSR
jgi:2-methylisocitrate lyase-like PEP mutase family enzyme